MQIIKEKPEHPWAVTITNRIIILNRQTVSGTQVNECPKKFSLFPDSGSALPRATPHKCVWKKKWHALLFLLGIIIKNRLFVYCKLCTMRSHKKRDVLDPRTKLVKATIIGAGRWSCPYCKVLYPNRHIIVVKCWCQEGYSVKGT